jgi:hypothetical protein
MSAKFILALQFYEGDQKRAMALARLIADIEPAYREDVVLCLITQPDTRKTKDITTTVKYCSEKILTQFVKSKSGAKGWQNGSGALWRATMEHCFTLSNGEGAVFTFDGGDGAPLCVNWVDRLIEGHRETLEQGKEITGSIMHGDIVNGNMVLETSLWNQIKDRQLRQSDKGAIDIWEVQYRDVLLPNVLSNSIICNEWNSRTGISIQGLSDRAKQGCVWSHGWKDEDLVDKARELILGETS